MAGLIAGAPGSLVRTADFGDALSGAVWAVSECVAPSWDSSLPGAAVVGRPRLRLIFTLLKVGRGTTAGVVPFDGVDVVETGILPPEGVRNLPRPDSGFSAFAELAVSFCTVSSSIGLWLPPGRGRLNPPPFGPLLPKRARVLWVGSTGASVVLIPLLDLNLLIENEFNNSHNEGIYKREFLDQKEIN